VGTDPLCRNEKSCAGCHSVAALVGPRGDLRQYRLLPLEKIGTDPTYARNIVTPVGDRAFSEVLLGLTARIRETYYREHGVPPEEQAAWEDRGRRGPDFFRDTLLGDVPGGRTPAYGSIAPGMGYRARHLAGVWATAPYLHNGSVPSIAALLRLEPRPERFPMRSHEYDPVRLGYSTAPAAALRGEGHEFGVQLSGADKRALIEYLKVLPPAEAAR
jgi:hypothetical protein